MNSRRQFLAGMTALGTSAFLSGSLSAQEEGGQGGGRGGRAEVQPPRTPPANLKEGRRIDVHHHYGTPLWIKTLADHQALNEIWKNWSVSQSVEDMDHGGVEISYSSVTTPGFYFGEGFGNGLSPGTKLNNDVRALVRDANEFGAKMKSDYPGRFGIWASLPLPYVDASLKEIEYALDKLKLDGIGLLTSIGSKYIGDAAFSPVFEELNRRNAILYTHPQVCPGSNYAVPKVGPTTLEYSNDTARAIVSWIESGSADRFPNIRLIFSHSGGSLWSGRYINGEIGTSRKAFENRSQQTSKIAHLRKFYYDTAQTSNFMQMENLKLMVGTTNIVFGTDHPYVQQLNYATDLEELKQSGTFTEQDLRNINRENILRILPKQAA